MLFDAWYETWKQYSTIRIEDCKTKECRGNQIIRRNYNIWFDIIEYGMRWVNKMCDLTSIDVKSLNNV